MSSEQARLSCLPLRQRLSAEPTEGGKAALALSPQHWVWEQEESPRQTREPLLAMWLLHEAPLCGVTGHGAAGCREEGDPLGQESVPRSPILNRPTAA